MAARVAVVGAGIVGLSTAWFLQEHDVHVTVYDRQHVAAGSSWGNAGWLNPSMTAPLPEPSVLRYGVRAVLNPSSPVYVPLRPDPQLLRFLTGFARHSTARRWATGMRAYAPVNRAAVAAFHELTDADVDARTYPADPFLACFRTPQESAGLREELEDIRASGQDVGYDVLTGAEARAAEPTLSDAIGCAVRLHDQHYINPPVFLAALADAVRRRGGRIVEGATVTDVRDGAGGAVLSTEGQAGESFDQVVLAHGAWLGGLARRFGVRQPIQAGRGYSFSVSGDRLPRAPLYFPSQRVACTPLTTPEGTRLRVAGTMEFRAPDAAADPRRIDAIVEAARPLLRGVDLDDRRDEWVGSRPCTVDGLPLIGPTSSPRVFVAGGHAMSGIFLGPITGKLLAQGIVSGSTPPELVPFDPLR
jgi:D-amino-acid dehydrogenase